MTPGDRPATERVAAFARMAAMATAFVLFLRWFNPARDQRLVDGLWLLGLLLWAWEMRHRGGGLLGARVRWADVLPIAALLAIFAAAWLPFYDNWRWAYTGDSFGVFGASYNLATKGLDQNLLSVHGIDNAFTVLWGVVYNIPMLIFGPTLFWHRVGQLIITCLAFATVYTFFAMVWGWAWSAAIVIGLATNHVLLFLTYVSYFKTDSFILYYLTLIFATLIWRDPARLGAWMCCGLTGGLSLFFTPTAWSVVALVNLLLGVYALATRRFGAVTVLVLSFVFGALPILRDIGWLLAVTHRQAGPLPDWHYVYRIAVAIILLPYDSAIFGLGIRGAFLRWPLGSLYLVGLALAVLAIVPPLRRRLRIPAVTPVLLALLLWDMLLLAMSNKGYFDPSPKRAYNLLPLQLFLALLPASVLWAWVGAYKWPRRATAALVVSALCVYAVLNLRLMMYPVFGMYGVNGLDALVELRQRFPDRRKLWPTSHALPLPALAADGLLNVTYHVLDNLVIVSDFSDAVMRRACAEQMLLCYEEPLDAARMQPLLEKYRGSLASIPLLNSKEVRCYDCIAPLSPPQEHLPERASVG